MNASENVCECKGSVCVCEYDSGASDWNSVFAPFALNCDASQMQIVRTRREREREIEVRVCM